MEVRLRAPVEPPPVRRPTASGHSLRMRNGGGEWPSRWEKGDRALSELGARLDHAPWIPDHAAGAVWICFRSSGASKISGPMSVEAARTLDAERAGGLCDKKLCDGQHAIVHAVPGRVRIEMTDPPKRRHHVTDQMKPHPQGLAGRVADALDDLALLRADPNADPQDVAWAKTKSDALIAALNADGDDAG